MPDFSLHSIARKQSHRRCSSLPSNALSTYPSDGHTSSISRVLKQVSGHVDRHSSATLGNPDIPEPRHFQSAKLPTSSYRTVPSIRTNAPQWPRPQTYVGQTLHDPSRILVLNLLSLGMSLVPPAALKCGQSTSTTILGNETLTFTYTP